MSYVSNYIVTTSVLEEEGFEQLCKSLDVAREDGSIRLHSEDNITNGKRMEANVMLFGLNYVDLEKFLDAVREVPWKEGLESVQVFYMGPNNTLFKDVTPWETVDYC